MEGLNKIISLFLGLIVVVIFFAIITGRIDLKNRFPKLGSLLTKPTAKPTPSTGKPKPKITIRVTSESTEPTNQYSKKAILTPAQKYSKITTIPATGAPTILLPIAFSTFLGGMFLRRKK